MSILAHATLGAPGLQAEKRDAHNEIQAELREARRIRALTNCTWTEALRQAAGKPTTTPLTYQENA